MVDLEKLTAPFDDKDIYFAPKQKGNGGKSALFFPHLKAEAIIKRLNDACGIMGWSSDSVVNNDGSVTFKISILDEDIWISHAGVGTADREDNADARKSAESDAIKRAARCFNVGLELWEGAYDAVWVDLDDKGRAVLSREEILAKSRGETVFQPRKIGINTKG